METSEGFQGKYRFLSNFALLDTPIEAYNLKFPTVEHFYQASKFLDPDMRKFIANHPLKGLKKFVRENEKFVREDWHDIKIGVMKLALNFKFDPRINIRFTSLLINTENVDLVEYNHWGDKFWGVCIKTGEGENQLGKLLEETRKTYLQLKYPSV